MLAAHRPAATAAHATGRRTAAPSHARPVAAPSCAPSAHRQWADRAAPGGDEPSTSNGGWASFAASVALAAALLISPPAFAKGDADLVAKAVNE